MTAEGLPVWNKYSRTYSGKIIFRVRFEFHTMSERTETDPPLMQRLYDRVWWLAVAALLFWALAYLGWGLLDWLSVPAGAV